MSDPIHDLEGLKHSGVDVNPLPAAEVRRRGTRLRRRNNALAAAGALAVVLVVASPIAVLARGGDHADNVPVAPSPSQGETPGTTWKQEIPAGFDLTALPKGQSLRFQARAYAGVDDLTLCGRPTFATGSSDPVGPALDTRGATYADAGTDGSLGRTLAVYPSDKVAAKVLDAVRSGVQMCPEDPNGRGATLVNAPLTIDLPADEGFVFTQQAQMDKDLLSDLTVWQVARVGNALYLATDHTSAGGPQVVDSQVQHLTTLSAPVLSDMCVFGAEPCDAPASTDASPVIGEGAVSAIPADFPLDAGLPSGGLGGTVPSPSLASCGRTLPKPDVVETSHAQWRSISEIRDRELMTFTHEADAQRYVESVAELYCTVDDLGSGAKRVTEGFGGAPFGDFSAIAVSHNEVDGRVDKGLVLSHVVRVGRAVLVSQRVDEGFTWGGDVDQQSVQLKGTSTDELRSTVAAMCIWTEQGC